jgi:hypothetical protein
LDPYLAPESEQFIYKRMTGQTGTQIGELSYRAGSTGNAGNLYRHISPRVQILQSHNMTDREGAYAHTIEVRSLGNGATGQETTIKIYGNPTGISGYESYFGT